MIKLILIELFQKVHMKVIIYDGFWDKHIARKYHNYLFIYGDNDIGSGCGGQAIIRKEPNACGIPTKRSPNNRDSSFYRDSEYEFNVEKIDCAISIIKARLKTGKYKGIIYPISGLGTGLSQLDTRAPLTFKYLNKAIRKLFKFVENYEPQS